MDSVRCSILGSSVTFRLVVDSELERKTKGEKIMKALLNIGAEYKATKELSSCILGILKANVDEQTKQIALKTLENGTSVNNATVHSCTLQGK